ncbi:hypothetical protein K469DRAFT_556815 [Zopfia rhizophila CBS 207.26]|uniref:RING-CH-type domain-containing protein n=1 Tax=Zopfia rhizophila CBS 207.26 TaxID=1314779 RepID=A0A6A6EID7_9PEZI|nr:hypothetical protein K469DRAFT_556815 [Zopfia rhizophila CBS 207.26]
MASLPPRPASQRRSQRESDSAFHNEQSHIGRTNSEAFSATSDNSQTLLLNRRQSSHSIRATEQQRTNPTQPQATQLDAEPRKCWICFNDETEDDPMSSEWRSPCPCVLVAHEKCLLDWIADMEAPSSRRRAGGRAKILCPQCKSEIRLVRPRSVVVDLVRTIERLTGLMLVPGIFFVIGSATYCTASLLGTQAVYEIFGMDDGLQILRPLYEAPDASDRSIALRLVNHLRHHWRLDIGLPLIPTALVCSRTTLTDSFLPFLPLIFFASSGRHQDEMLQIQWPPSAAFTVAALPYLRGVYNAYYERVWLPREQQWLKEIQPRAGDNEGGNHAVEDNDGDNDHIHDPFEDDDGVVEALELEVDFDLLADWGNGGAADNNNAPENPPVPIARGPAPPLNAPPQDEQDPAPAPNVPQRRNRPIREHVALSSTSLADTILGALIFPSIAAVVGEALKFAVPKSWVTPPANGKPTGFLQARWGRSIIGGCLFVGIKDAVMLYVRWKMAQNHRKRRVLDYDKSKKKTARS